MFKVDSRDIYDNRVKIYEEVIDSSTTTTYVGIAQQFKYPAESDAKRRVYKIVETKPSAWVTKTKYHFSVTWDTFSYAWSNRASLIYTD